MTLIPHEFAVVTGPAVHALVDLSRLSGRPVAETALGRALQRIGDPTGETWLHLLGICLEMEPPLSWEGLIELVAGFDPEEFRLLLLGARAWSWRAIVGLDVIAAAAGGDPEAARRLLDNDRFYGGNAAAALARILPLSSAETRRRFLDALEAYPGVPDGLDHRLQVLADRVEHLADEKGWVEAVDLLTGYRYFPEPEARRVVVMPHLAGPGLVLAQHDEARLIVFGESPPASLADRVVEVGRALADPSRVAILATLSSGPHELADLTRVTDLTRSTVHHHLRLLRAAGLVAVEGNARSYRYRLDDRGRAELAMLFSELLGERP